jgi:hypothetical protein
MRIFDTLKGQGEFTRLEAKLKDEWAEAGCFNPAGNFRETAG